MKQILLLLVVISFTLSFSSRAQSLVPISEGINTSGSSSPYPVTKFRDNLYLFQAYNPLAGREIYVTNGTQAGTYLLKDINPGSSNGAGDLLAPINDSIYIFLANDGDNNHGLELWRTDGTSSNTYMITDLTPGPASTQFQYSYYNYDPYKVLDNKLFFLIDTAISNFWVSSLWVTDGTIGGTIRLTGNIGAGNVLPTSNGIGYFFAILVQNNFQLWRTDGTVTGTFKLIDLNSNGGAALGGDFVFSASDSVHGQELWKTDGTVNGTAMIKDINPGPDGSKPGNFTLLGNKLIFQTYSSGALYATDGTSSGTYPLGDSSVFLVGSHIEFMGISGNEVLFLNDYDSNFQSSIWKSDGTVSGTIKLHSFPDDTYRLAAYHSLINAEGLTFFPITHVYDPYYPYQTTSIWATDGSDSGTYQVYDNPTVDVNESFLQLSSACDQGFCVMIVENKTNIWRVQPDTATILDLFSTKNESTTIWLVDDSLIFFTARNSPYYDELYKLNACTYTSIESIFPSGSFLLFPNPNDGNFTVQLSQSLKEGFLSVIDMTGRCLYYDDVSNSSNSFELYLGNLPQGIYLLRIGSGEKNWQQIFVKQQ